MVVIELINILFQCFENRPSDDEEIFILLYLLTMFSISYVEIHRSLSPSSRVDAREF